MHVITISLAALLLFTSCAGKNRSSSPERVSPLVGTFQVHRYSLNNGLRILVVEDHSSPTLAYQTWFRVGSRDEVPHFTGLAHLFEHMMFKGTVAHPGDMAFDKLMEGVGAEGVNAFTSHDSTTYVQELPRDQLRFAADIESDRMVNLVVDERSFRTELAVVQNERRYRNENNPDGFIEQELYALAFKHHPYHWPVIGYAEDLDRMSADDARRFYQANYNPAHATVVVVGDVRPDEVLSVISEKYGKLPSVLTPDHINEQEPPQSRYLQKRIKLNIQVDKLLVGYHVPSTSDVDDAALEALAAVLSNGSSSRLYRALIDSGIAGSVDANNPGEKDPSLFTISVSLQKGKTAAQAQKVVEREIARLVKEPVGTDELDRAKHRLDFDFYTSLASNHEKAHFIGYFESNAGSFETGLKIHKKIDALAPKDLQAAAKAYFKRSNESVMIATPKGSK